ncbi:MAG: DNA-formamidopyrimidine glycosylase family protein [Tepidisphaeraceae bacterium]
MPELPDVMLYLDALRRTVVGQRLDKLRVVSPFLLRTFEPPTEAVEGRTLVGVERIGKRIVFDFGDDLFAVVHLMIAGRWRWSAKPKEKTPGKVGLATWLFENGSLHLIEASPKKRASLHIVQGRDALRQFNRGGLDPLSSSLEHFAARLRSENHTLKRTLTDPRLFDGIGNAYSDEILFFAKCSPIKLTSRVTDDEVARLHEQCRNQLTAWTTLLLDRFRTKFPGPGDVTAFRPEFAVHGKFGKPCIACGTSIQRIVHAENETNYCPRCQTEGKLLADRSLSRLLKDDWPATIEELEEQRGRP